MIIRAAKFATNIIAEGQPNVYGFTISQASPDGEAIQLKNIDLDTETLTPEEQTIVNDFIALMALKLT